MIENGLFPSVLKRGIVHSFVLAMYGYSRAMNDINNFQVCRRGIAESTGSKNQKSCLPVIDLGIQKGCCGLA